MEPRTPIPEQLPEAVLLPKKNTKLFWIVGGVVGVLMIAAAVLVNHHTTAPSTVATATPTPSAQAGSVAANTSESFDLRFFNAVSGGAGNKNLMVSPLSLAQALAMTYNGAAGTTQTAMAKTLGITEADLTAYNQANQAKITALTASDPSVSLNIANSLWARQGFTLNSDFVNRSKTYYNAQVTSLNFDDPTAPAAINNWVNTVTNGKIPTILDSIPSGEMLYLVDAVYFKGDWQNQFDASATTNRNFTVADSTVASVPTMSQENSFPYYENSDFQMVSLPYGTTGNLSMDIILPKSTTGLSTVYSQLTSSNWQSWLSHLTQTETQVYLPKFTASYSDTLNDTLSQLGMAVAFDSKNANFAGMENNPTTQLFISQVLQKTYIQVAEQGTEASAATSIGMQAMATIVKPAPVATIDLNHPFFYAIRDASTNTVLFMGTMSDPR